MFIPDSLQKLGYDVFYGCSKLVPSNINVEDNDTVVAYLQSQVRPSPLKRKKEEEEIICPP